MATARALWRCARFFFRATFFQELSSNCLVSKTLSDEEIRRIKELFHKLLGRDLSSDEQKYLGLSSIVVSIGDLELSGSVKDRRQIKLVNKG